MRWYEFKCFFLPRLFSGTLRRQLSIFLIILLISAVALIGIVSIKIAQQVIKSHTARFGGKMLTQAAFRLGSLINNAETTVDSLILDRRLAPLLHNLVSSDRRLKEGARRTLGDLLIQYKASLLPGADLIIIDPSGNIVTTYQLPPASPSLITVARVRANLPHQYQKWRLLYLPKYNTNETASGRLLELTARIVSLPGRPQAGWIILQMDYRMVESIMTNISLQENAMNRFQSEVIVFGPEKQVIFPWVAPSDRILNSAYRKMNTGLRNTEVIEEKANGKSFLVIAAVVPWTPWQIYISAPTSSLYTGLEKINNSIMVIGLIFSLIATFSATVFSFFITKPVNKLQNAMHLVEEGDFSVVAPEEGPLEIKTLGRAFNRMLGEVEMLTKRLVAEESKRKTAVIKTLQAQIAPHFLFNTLAAMAGMTSECPPEEVAEALRSLKCLLFLSIGKSNDFVSLADEFEHIRHYLYLMNIRYPGKFSLRMELPAEFRQCRTIRLILQPIVENCLQHGFKTRGGLVRVFAFRRDGDVIIKIADNGQGMSPEKLRLVWEQEQSGMGIRNVDERLKLSFGPGYGLTVTSSESKGTVVALRIPFQMIAETEFPVDKGQI